MKGKQSIEQIKQAGLLGCKVLHDKAIKRYYDDPNKCLLCGKIIEIEDEQKISDVRKKKFCNSSCSAKYNNTKRIKMSSITICEKCGDIIYLNSNNKGGFNKRKYCDRCAVLNCKRNGENAKNRMREKNGFISSEVTKGFLYEKYKSEIARTKINMHARKIYAESGCAYKCVICGYDKHVQISHIKGISEFDDDAKVIEINDIKNLVALCPTHHWEYDHDIIKCDDILNTAKEKGYR